MTIDLNTLVSVLFIAGGGGAVMGIVNVVKTIRSGKIENEDTLIRRLDADNRNQQAARKEAEARADEAEREAEEYRKQRNQAKEKLARIRWHVMQKYGDELQGFGSDDD